MMMRGAKTGPSGAGYQISLPHHPRLVHELHRVAAGEALVAGDVVVELERLAQDDRVAVGGLHLVALRVLHGDRLAAEAADEDGELAHARRRLFPDGHAVLGLVLADADRAADRRERLEEAVALALLDLGE